MHNPKNRRVIHHLFVLDESASMQSIQGEALNAMSDTLLSIRRDAERNRQDHFVSLLSFNSRSIKQHLYYQHIQNIDHAFEINYKPDGGSPLMDCLGLGIGLIQVALKRISCPSQVMVTIVTDGAENGSKKYCSKSISTMIRKLKSNGWIFNYIGANHDVKKACRQLSIDNHYIFKQSGEGVRNKMMKERLVKTTFSHAMANAQSRRPNQAA